MILLRGGYFAFWIGRIDIKEHILVYIDNCEPWGVSLGMLF